MEIPKFEKRSTESRLINFDFSSFAEIKAGQSITAADPIAWNPVTGAPTATNPTFSGGVAQTRIAAGTAGKRYLAKCKVTTTDGSVLQREGYVVVLDPVA